MPINMAEIIKTTRNRTYKYIKSLQQKKVRTAEGCFTVEGIKSVSDALNSEFKIELIAVSESLYGRFDCRGVKSVVICDEIFGGLCDTKTPQGVIAVIRMREKRGLVCDTKKLYVYCDNVSDPGNLGTIIRTADAAGFGGLLLSPGCADLYSPKTVRASMGSFFNIEAVTDVGHDALRSLADKGFNIYSGALSDDSEEYTSPDYTKPSLFVIGNEANGVSDEVLSFSHHIIIPIYGAAESLNAAVAGAVIMYEAIRQRRGRLNENRPSCAPALTRIHKV